MEIELDSTDAATHLSVSLDPVYYVGITLAVDRNSSEVLVECSRESGEGCRWIERERQMTGTVPH
jgi:hypothetical protein